MWSSGASQWSSWPAQAQNIQNMNHDEVDWASLAKQWIQMKENVTTPPPPPPLPPDPPKAEVTLSAPAVDAHTAASGEADMEIEDDKEINTVEMGRSVEQPYVQPQTGEQNNGDAWSGWWNNSSHTNASQAPWGWNWPMSTQDSTHSSMVGMPTGHGNIAQSQYAEDQNYQWVEPEEQRAPIQQYSTGRDSDYKKHSNSRSRNNYGGSSYPEKMADFQLDAAQRKKLPLWIREGLEKMEQEKQKKLDKEREKQHREEMLRQKKEAEAHARAMLKEGIMSDGQPRIPDKSRFDSESESEGETDKERSSPVKEEIKNEEPNDTGLRLSERIPSPVVNLTPEEKLEQMMLKLRRWMTEILLDVTTSMIREVAEEVVEKSRRKASVVQVKKPTSALSALSGNSGLIMYSESESDSEDGGTNNRGRDDDDSDAELRKTIERKKRAFEKTERAILHKLQKQEEEERERKRRENGQGDDQSREDESGSEEEKNDRSSPLPSSPSPLPDKTDVSNDQSDARTQDSVIEISNSGNDSNTADSSSSSDSDDEESSEDDSRKKSPDRRSKRDKEKSNKKRKKRSYSVEKSKKGRSRRSKSDDRSSMRHSKRSKSIEKRDKRRSRKSKSGERSQSDERSNKGRSRRSNSSGRGRSKRSRSYSKGRDRDRSLSRDKTKSHSKRRRHKRRNSSRSTSLSPKLRRSLSRSKKSKHSKKHRKSRSRSRQRRKHKRETSSRGRRRSSSSESNRRRRKRKSSRRRSSS